MISRERECECLELDGGRRYGDARIQRVREFDQDLSRIRGVA